MFAILRQNGNLTIIIIPPMYTCCHLFVVGGGGCVPYWPG